MLGKLANNNYASAISDQHLNVQTHNKAENRQEDQ